MTTGDRPLPGTSAMDHPRVGADKGLIDDLARSLFEAERERRTRQPLSRAFPHLSGDDAYAIQESYAELRIAAGAKLVGRKIGATSRAIQELFGIDTPDYGHIFDDMVVRDGATVRRDHLIQPMVEPELAFLLADDLTGQGHGRDDVLAATDAVLPCLEVIDSRITDWQIAFVDTVADNGSSARCVFGPPALLPDPHSIDLAAVEGEMRHNGEVVARATGAAVLGHPADAVAWLANRLAGYGRSLRAGDYVLSGSFMTAVRVAAGDRVEADFRGIGGVSVTFV